VRGALTIRNVSEFEAALRSDSTRDRRRSEKVAALRLDENPVEGIHTVGGTAGTSGRVMLQPIATFERRLLRREQSIDRVD
jgi:limonene-1,2-epoxide hydrolase